MAGFMDYLTNLMADSGSIGSEGGATFNKFATGAGMIGQALGGDTTGGQLGKVSQFLGQSGIAGKAEKEMQKKKDSFQQRLLDVLGGKTKLTKPGSKGISGFKVSPNESGLPEITMSSSGIDEEEEMTSELGEVGGATTAPSTNKFESLGAAFSSPL